MRPVRKIGFGASYQNQNQTSLGQLSFLVLPYGPPRDESWGRVTSDRMVCGTPWISLELGPARGAQGLWATPDTSIRKKRSCSSGSICRRFGRKYERALPPYWGTFSSRFCLWSYLKRSFSSFVFLLIRLATYRAWCLDRAASLPDCFI
jgi:hypothetical protein